MSGMSSMFPPSSMDGRMSIPLMPGSGFPGFPAPPPSQPATPYTSMLVKDDPAFKKYFKLQQMGMPTEQIKMKMQVDKVDPTLIDRPEDVSPNDPGVSIAT